MSNSGDVTNAPVDYLLKVDNPLVVPVGQKIRIITTANDVIHSFMVPAFGIKQDAIPGFVRDTWFRADQVGDYYGQCAELCGKEHAYMPIHVKVLSAQDYSQWVQTEMKKVEAKRDDPCASGRWTISSSVARRSMHPTARLATRRNGKGAGSISARWLCHRERRQPCAPDSDRAARGCQWCHAVMETIERHGSGRSDQLYQERMVEQDGPARAAC